MNFVQNQNTRCSHYVQLINHSLTHSINQQITRRTPSHASLATKKVNKMRFGAEIFAN